MRNARSSPSEASSRSGKEMIPDNCGTQLLPNGQDILELIGCYAVRNQTLCYSSRCNRRRHGKGVRYWADRSRQRGPVRGISRTSSNTARVSAPGLPPRRWRGYGGYTGTISVSGASVANRPALAIGSPPMAGNTGRRVSYDQ